MVLQRLADSLWAWRRLPSPSTDVWRVGRNLQIGELAAAARPSLLSTVAMRDSEEICSHFFEPLG